MTFTLSPEDVARCRAINIGNREMVMDIVRAVAEQAEIHPGAIIGPSRKRNITEARWLVCRLAFEAGHNVSSIARVLKKDHTSVLHGLARERERLNGEGRAT